MKFALINGEKSEAIKGSKGFCPICESELVARCGDVKIHHWAHKGNRNCDPWWENETDWHRSWKNNFPIKWQEVVHFANNGEKHIADVKTPNGWIIEFQHSYLNPDERRARNNFYGKLIWVVDGTRLKRDSEKFKKALNLSTQVGNIAQVRRVRTDNCTLIRQWSGSSHVFFDFGGMKVLWWLVDGGTKDIVYIAPFSCSDFIEIHQGKDKQKTDEFNNFTNELNGLVKNYELSLRRRR